MFPGPTLYNTISKQFLITTLNIILRYDTITLIIYILSVRLNKIDALAVEQQKKAGKTVLINIYWSSYVLINIY